MGLFYSFTYDFLKTTKLDQYFIILTMYFMNPYKIYLRHPSLKQGFVYLQKYKYKSLN